MTAVRNNALSRAVILLTAVAFALSLLLASAVRAQGDPPPTVQHRVAAGETLWEIAAGIAAEGEDVRDIVYRIRHLNGLESSLIGVGDVLRVPMPGA